MPETVKTLSDQKAFDLHVKNKKLKFSVSAKFDEDHIIKASLSSKNSKEAAIERYKRNQKIKKSSWIMLDKATLLNKAKGASVCPCIHSGKQQLATTISVTRRTVVIDELTFKEAQTYKCEEVEIGKEKKYLNCTSEEATVKLHIKGGWNPLTGDVDLYHYEEGTAPTTPKLLEKYRKWVHDDGGKPIRPDAKK